MRERQHIVYMRLATCDTTVNVPSEKDGYPSFTNNQNLSFEPLTKQHSVWFQFCCWAQIQPCQTVVRAEMYHQFFFYLCLLLAVAIFLTAELLKGSRAWKVFEYENGESSCSDTHLGNHWAYNWNVIIDTSVVDFGLNCCFNVSNTKIYNILLR